MNPLDRILDVKQKIKDDMGFEPDEQRLIFGSACTPLEDDRTLSQCGITNGSELHLVLRMFVPRHHVPQVPQVKVAASDEPLRPDSYFTVEVRHAEIFHCKPDEFVRVEAGGRVRCAVETGTTYDHTLFMHFRPLQPLPVGRDVSVHFNRDAVHLGESHAALFPSFTVPEDSQCPGVPMHPIAVTVRFHGPGLDDGVVRKEKALVVLLRTGRSQRRGAGHLLLELIEAMAAAARVRFQRIGTMQWNGQIVNADSDVALLKHEDDLSVRLKGLERDEEDEDDLLTYDVTDDEEEEEEEDSMDNDNA